jgi:LysR family glycine cleavage system transcriptional activator
MTRRLPPLNALRAFEAAGRHLSLTRAAAELNVTPAAELNVTPAAVSHQVKALEAYLAVALFRRRNRALLLTDAGQACLPGLGEGFELLERAIERLKQHDAQGPLQVSVAPAFATKWLVPRLESFEIAHPDIDLRISASLEVVDLDRAGFDAAIRLGRGVYPGFEVRELFSEVVVPMCAPRLVDGPKPLRRLSDLRQHVLLHDDSLSFEKAAPGWSTWLKAAAVKGVDARRGPRFSHPDHAMQAAMDGAGVVLGWRRLASADLAAGRLAIPFDVPLPMGLGFFLVSSAVSSRRPKVRAFQDWLLAELSETRDS